MELGVMYRPMSKGRFDVEIRDGKLFIPALLYQICNNYMIYSVQQLMDRLEVNGSMFALHLQWRGSEVAEARELLKEYLLSLGIPLEPVLPMTNHGFGANGPNRLN